MGNNTRKYYILNLRSYEGNVSSLKVNANGSDSMYVVLAVMESLAGIVDWGYGSAEEILSSEAWKDKAFENVGEYVSTDGALESDGADIVAGPGVTGDYSFRDEDPDRHPSGGLVPE